MRRLAPLLLAALALGGCNDGAPVVTDEADGGNLSYELLSGEIRIDASAASFPLVLVASELFGEEQPGVLMTVRQPPADVALDRLCAGQTDAVGSIRRLGLGPRGGCRRAEVQVANDALAVIANERLPVDCLTVVQLRRLWNARDPVSTLAEVDSQLPDVDVELRGGGPGTGSAERFAAALGLPPRAVRDYPASAGDQEALAAVERDPNALGFVAFSSYEKEGDDVRLVAVDSGDGRCVEPTEEHIQDGSYRSLAGPVFLYPSARALARPEVKVFFDFLIEGQDGIAEAAGFVPMTDAQRAGAADAVKSAEAAG